MVVPMRTYQGQAIVDTGRSVSASAGTAALICFANTMNVMAAIGAPELQARWADTLCMKDEG